MPAFEYSAQGSEELWRRGSRGHHRHRRLRQFLQIGGNVEAVFRPLVNAADPARGENPDPGARGASASGTASAIGAERWPAWIASWLGPRRRAG